jgi:hypothetical protein
MTCLVLGSSSAAPSMAKTYPLAWSAVIGSTPTRRRGPRTCDPTPGITSEPSAADAGSLSAPKTTGGSRPTVRSADGRSGPAPKPCSNCRKPRSRGQGRGTRLCEVCRAHEEARHLCVRCGGEKSKVRGARLCDSCERLPHGVRNPESRRHPCARCGSDELKRPGVKFCSECAPIEHEAAERRKAARRRLKQKSCRAGCGRRVMRLPNGKTSHYCAPCRRERIGQPRICERCPNPSRGKHKKLCEACFQAARIVRREKANAWQRAHPRSGRRPVKGRAGRESKRMTYRLNVQRSGRSLPPVDVVKGAVLTNNMRADTPLFPSLPVAPLAAKVEALIHREQAGLNILGRPCDGGDDTRTVVCERLGIHSRRLYAWAHGEATSIQFDTLDAILVKAGWLWFDVFEPCPGDNRHYREVAESGRCERCETYCVAEEAFTSERTGEELPGSQQRLDVAA